MKNIFVMVLFFTMVIKISYAQVEEESKLNTVIDSGKFISGKFILGKNVYSGYIYPIIGTTSVLNDRFGLTIGGGANLLVNRKFYFGAFGEGVSVIIDKNEVGAMKLSGSNFGGVIGYIHGIENPISFDFNMRIGGSYFAMSNTKISQNSIDMHVQKDGSIGFLLNPRVGVNFNISQFLIVNTALGYRFYVEGSAHKGLKGENFSGPSLSFQLNFGSF